MTCSRVSVFANRRSSRVAPGGTADALAPVVIETDAVRRAIEQNRQLTITVVPIVRSVTSKTGIPEDVLKYDTVKILTYR